MHLLWYDEQVGDFCMKKILLSICLFFVIVSFCFADSWFEAKDNSQKIYEIDCLEYQLIKNLYLAAGYGMPSSTGPWNYLELWQMVLRVDREALDENAKKLYDQIYGVFDVDYQSQKTFRPRLDLTFEGYLHTNTSEHFQLRSNWIRGFNEQKRPIEVIFENFLAKNFYGYFEITLGNANRLVEDHNFGSRKFSSNLPMILGCTIKDLDFSFPWRAFVAAGGDSWSIEFGKDRINWGLGKTGNLIVGGHLPYHNALRTTVFTNHFKYTFLVSSFPHPCNYYQEGVGLNIHGQPHGQSQLINGISAFIAHRLEWRLFNEKVGVALTEGVMYMADDNRIDLSVLNPSMLYHNNYTRSYTNSILGIEVDWTIMKGLNVYAQVALDDFNLPGETSPKSATPGNEAEPTAIAFLGGVTYSAFLNSGVLTANLEAAKTPPFMYLRDGDMASGTSPRTQSLGQYGINYVVAIRNTSGAGGTMWYDEAPLGYEYGPDAIVANLNLSFMPYSGKFNASVNGFYMIHGTHDIWTVWSRFDNSTVHYVETPTTKHQTANQNDPNANLRDCVSKTLVLGAQASYAFTKNFNVGLQADFIKITNPGNRSTAKSVKDFQLTFSFGYSLY